MKAGIDLKRIALTVLGAVLALLLIPLAWVLAWRGNFVDELWPSGQTRSIRADAERVFPPPTFATFATARRLGGGWDTSYRECVAYATDALQSVVFAYYREHMERYGWRVRASDRLLSLQDPQAVPATFSTQQVWPNTVVVSSSGGVSARAEASIWFSLSPRADEPPSTYQLCSPSWNQVRAAMLGT